MFNNCLAEIKRLVYENNVAKEKLTAFSCRWYLTAINEESNLMSDWKFGKLYKLSITSLVDIRESDEIVIETQKKEILESYLPAMLSREQTEALINETVAKLWITDLKTQRWLLMKELMANHKSELDGALVNDIINSKL